MQTFTYKRNRLYSEDVPVGKIAREVGTPFYLYSQGAIERQFTAFESAFSRHPHLTCYAVKANSNLAILNLMRSLRSGFDIVSGGELMRVLEINGLPGKVVFSGVGKTEQEIDLGLGHGIMQFNVESEGELRTIAARARAMGMVAPIGLRVNPDVDAQTHPYQTTGRSQDKFGISISETLELMRWAEKSRHLKLMGIGFHIGSQITRIEPFLQALRRVKELFAGLNESGFRLHNLDIGGGLGIRYRNETPPDVNRYAEAVIKTVGDLECHLLLEPGRVIVGNAGILVTRVLQRKQNLTKKFVVVDAAINDLMRPSLYRAYHDILPEKRAPRAVHKADVVGPICESGDFLARDRMIPDVKAGELLAIMNAGAYGFALSSNYNGRLRVPEVLVRAATFKVIRKRERFSDLIRGESKHYLAEGHRPRSTEMSKKGMAD